jgi:hypothetical protein
MRFAARPRVTSSVWERTIRGPDEPELRDNNTAAGDMAIASGLPATPLSILYSGADGVPQGVRLRIALDVLGALADRKFSLARRSSEGLSLSSVSVATDGTAHVAIGPATDGAPELVWEVLAGCPAEGELRSLREVVDEIPIDVSELVEKVLGADPELESASELLDALERASEGHVASREDVIEIALARGSAIGREVTPPPVEPSKPAPIESPKAAEPAPTSPAPRVDPPQPARVEAPKAPAKPPAPQIEAPIEAPTVAAQAPEPAPPAPKPAEARPSGPKPAAPKPKAAGVEDDWDTEVNAATPWPAKGENDKEARKVPVGASPPSPGIARKPEVPSMRQTLAFGTPRPAVPAASPPPPKTAARRAPTMRYPQKSSPDVTPQVTPTAEPTKTSTVETVPVNAEPVAEQPHVIETPPPQNEPAQSTEVQAPTPIASEAAQVSETSLQQVAPAVAESSAPVESPRNEAQEAPEPAARPIEFGPRPMAPVAELAPAPTPAPSPIASPRSDAGFTIKGTQIIRAPAAPATPPNTSAAAFERTLRPEEAGSAVAAAAAPPPSAARPKLESFDETMATRRRPTRALGKRQLGVGVILVSVLALVALAIAAILASH